MANIYIGQMKDVLKKYHEKQRKLNIEFEDNYKRFSPEYAESENAKVKAKQAQAYQEARQSINSIYEKVRGFLACANFINVEKMTADKMIFEDNSGFVLTREDILAFAERYEGNFTMLRLLNDWLMKHNDPQTDGRFGKYDDIKIIMPADMLSVYKQFAESALSLCDEIYTNEQLVQNPVKIEYYADERMASDLLATVGSGMGLSDYKSHRVPESVQHCFDDVILSSFKNNSNIYVA